MKSQVIMESRIGISRFVTGHLYSNNICIGIATDKNRLTVLYRRGNSSPNQGSNIEVEPMTFQEFKGELRLEQYS